ncbi:MAG: hypothetical protein OEV92_00725 [Nitrospinota bacterium]|nr:hypothetical protein [Nitrospinota bacterium]
MERDYEALLIVQERLKLFEFELTVLKIVNVLCEMWLQYANQHEQDAPPIVNKYKSFIRKYVETYLNVW